MGRRKGRRVSLAASTVHEAREQTPNCVQDRMSTVSARGAPKMRNKSKGVCWFGKTRAQGQRVGDKPRMETKTCALGR